MSRETTTGAEVPELSEELFLILLLPRREAILEALLALRGDSPDVNILISECVAALHTAAALDLVGSAMAPTEGRIRAMAMAANEAFEAAKKRPGF